MAPNRQDSLFTTPITECGPHGIPTIGNKSLTTAEIQKTISQTCFTITVDSDMTTPWITWLNALGDVNAAYVRNLEIVLPRMEVQITINPPRTSMSRVCGSVKIKGDDEVRLVGELEEWLERSFEDVRGKRMMVYGDGEFTRKEFNKIGKAVFRLEAVGHVLGMRFEREGDIVMDDDDEEVAVEDEDEDEGGNDQDFKDFVQGLGGRNETTHKEPRRKMRTGNDSFAQDEIEFREHARTCDVCACKWVEKLDGHPDLYVKIIREQDLGLKRSGSKHGDTSACGRDCHIKHNVATKPPEPSKKAVRLH